MTTQIALHNDIKIRCGNSGGFVVENLSNHPKYYGRMVNAMSVIGWVSVREKLEGVRDHYYSVTKPMGPLKLSYKGESGIQTSESIPKSQCVELIMNYATVSHLAKSDTATTKLFPGNHGQALALMIEQDIEDCAVKNGPFTSEASLLSFIEERCALASEAVESAEKISGYYELDDDEETEEESVEEEAA